jgi:hypothetical protein
MQTVTAPKKIPRKKYKGKLLLKISHLFLALIASSHQHKYNPLQINNSGKVRWEPSINDKK